MNVQNVDMSGKPTVISLFAGTGGSSLGYHLAGYQELLAVDFDAHAVECFSLNFPNIPIWQRSITDITADEILSFCDLKPGDLDVLDGSPPCQGFSTAGKRKVTDMRNDLFREYVRLIQGLQPKVFVMENVSGMAKGKMKGRFLEILATLKATGYTVKCKQMNAMYYGVPQDRERLIFIGSKAARQASFFPEIGDSHPISIRELFPYVTGHRNAQFDNTIKSPNIPASTVTKTRCMEFIVAGQARHPTISECLALCSFPQDWKMKGSDAQKWARLGNAVMPKFMEAIAANIRKNLINI